MARTIVDPYDDDETIEIAPDGWEWGVTYVCCGPDPIPWDDDCTCGRNPWMAEQYDIAADALEDVWDLYELTEIVGDHLAKMKLTEVEVYEAAARIYDLATKSDRMRLPGPPNPRRRNHFPPMLRRGYDLTTTRGQLECVVASVVHVGTPHGFDSPCAILSATPGTYPQMLGRPAHRLVWELMVGPIPDGLDVDHRCRETRCVNPQHLEPVTSAENTRRANAARRAEKAGELWNPPPRSYPVLTSVPPLPTPTTAEN